MTIMIPAWVDGKLVPVEKLEAHQKGLKHKAVSVFVLRGSEILLQRRAMNKYHTPGLWANTCCTHPDWEEAPHACALRRLKQELGITGLTPDFRHHLEYRADVGNNLIEHEAVDVYIAYARDNLRVTPNPDEVVETRWLDYHDLLTEISRKPDSFTPWLKIYLRDYADTIFGTDLTARAPLPALETGSRTNQ
jgi:isopentenyl-diphosphate Delta-isomerase